MSVEVEYLVTPNEIPKTFDPTYNGSLSDYTANYATTNQKELSDILNFSSGTVKENGKVLSYFDGTNYVNPNHDLTWWQKKDIYEQAYTDNKSTILKSTNSKFGFNELASEVQKKALSDFTSLTYLGAGIFSLGALLDFQNIHSGKNNDTITNLAFGAKSVGLGVSTIKAVSTYGYFNNLYNTSLGVDKLIGASGMYKTIGLAGTTIGGMLIADGLLNIYKNYKTDKSKLKYVAAGAEVIGGGASVYTGMTALTNPLVKEYFIESTALTTTSINGSTVGTSYAMSLNTSIADSLIQGVGLEGLGTIGTVGIGMLGMVGAIVGIAGMVGLGIYNLMKPSYKKSKGKFKLKSKKSKKGMFKGFGP